MDKIFEGDLTAEKGKVYEYIRITGSLYASGADMKTAFPKLTTVGGFLYGGCGVDEPGDVCLIHECVDRALALIPRTTEN